MKMDTSNGSPKPGVLMAPDNAQVEITCRVDVNPDAELTSILPLFFQSVTKGIHHGSIL